MAAIRFLLGREPRSVSGLDPTTTVLEYLRTVERRCGTKEGCAEGDCGACTVVLGEPGPDGKLDYRAVNSCIQFLPTLDGRQLITVEDLAAPDGALHPVQQAMVDCHGSQCGFCTPGFVMSLFALQHAGAPAGREAALQALAGNLCRCTGYRPILDAAERVVRTRARDRFDAQEAATADALRGLARTEGLAYEHAGRAFHAPHSLAELILLLRRFPSSWLLAGGTDFGLWVTKQHREFDRIVHLGRVPELQTIASTPTHLELGAAVTWRAALPALAELHPDLRVLLLRFASEQIRNVATVGGNVANASPIGDGPPPLLALGASVVIAGPDGARELPLDEFFLAYRKTALRPGEFVAKLRIPRPDAATRFGVYKLSKRFDQDISAVCGAYCVTLENGRVAAARIAYGGMAATPKRAHEAERALAGRPWTIDSVRAAMDALERDFAPIDDMRASAAYRRLAARNLLLRFHLEATGAGATQVAAYG